MFPLHANSSLRVRTALRQCGFTLIELVVVIGIVAILAVISLPVYRSVLSKGRQTTTLNNMHQIGVACLLYTNDNNYKLPNRATATDGQAVPDKWPKLFQPYVQDIRVYISPIPDVKGVSYRPANEADVLKNDKNFTSYIMNGYNDLGAMTNSAIYPRVNNIAMPTKTILFGIPYPQKNNFYMDFAEGGGNNNEVLNRTAFNDTSIYVFSDGSTRPLKYRSTDNMKAEPTSSDYYTDWLWLIDKTNTATIQ